MTQAVDIIDDGMGQHDAFGGTEDATMEFGPDESLDSLLDAGGHLNETHTFDGSADFMVTRIDTSIQMVHLGSLNQHSPGPQARPERPADKSGFWWHSLSSRYWPAPSFGLLERLLRALPMGQNQQ